ncbi:MAG: methyl-accepting chemotaxis protein, partial [Spirochaetaceae bacterium]|nr:methyl-accepting chemotaxis protein [Spirochaetaceae bacterium]
RAKLLGSFIIIAAIGVFLGVLGLYSDDRLTDSSTDLLDLSETRTRISSILSSHYTWRHLLTEAVYTKAKFTGSLDSTACSLGKWLNSDEVKAVADQDVISLLHQIVEPHHFIHGKAGEIVHHIDNVEMDEAARKLEEEILPKTQEVISFLEKMNDRYGVLLKDKTQKIYNLGVMYKFIIIVFIIVALIVSVLLALVITSNIVKPILPLSAFMEKVGTTGDIVMSREDSAAMAKHMRRKDEIGMMIRSFNYTLEKIREMVISIRKKAETLYGIGNNLATDMNETAVAINEITSNIQSNKGRVLNQSASVSETHATMEQVVANINRLDGLVDDQSSHISGASSAIEKMVANINSVAGTLVSNTANVKTLQEASEVGRAGLQEVAQDIQEISRESEGLMEINSVMQNIASQTNLLSMNAAIEAAHAGETGKGFAVVADEIRKLAVNSSKQSKTIASVLKKIKGSIDKITGSTGNVLEKFEAIDSSIRIVSEQEDNMRRAMEEQGVGSRHILEGVGSVTEITRKVTQSADEMLEGSKEVIHESDNLEKATQEIASGMTEMASGADKINVAVNHVNELSGKNRENIDLLIQEVSRFKVE